MPFLCKFTTSFVHNIQKISDLMLTLFPFQILTCYKIKGCYKQIHNKNSEELCSLKKKTKMFQQCSGSEQNLTGSGSKFRKRPGPDPDPKIFSANFF
jgi:hypothetical protein